VSSESFSLIVECSFFMFFLVAIKRRVLSSVSFESSSRDPLFREVVSSEGLGRTRDMLSAGGASASSYGLK